MNTRLRALAFGGMEALLLLAAAAIPLFVNYYGFRVFELGKGALLIAFGAMAAALGVIALAEGGGASLRSVGRAVRQPLGVAALVLGGATALATATASVPGLAFYGAPERQQGLLQLMAALALFGAAAAVGRSADSRDRIIAVLAAAGVPVALYALTQAAGLEAVPGRVEDSRVFGTLSNPIFLGAYLMMLAPIVVVRAGAAVRAGRTIVASSWIVVLALQLLALWLTASRGPILGLVIGLGALALAAAAVRRKAGTAAAILGLALGGLLLLGLLNWRDGPLTGLADAPVLGRFAQISATTEGSQAVRLRVWDAVARLTAAEPARLATGHGPESLRHALLPYGDTYLAGQGQADRLVDRSHSVPFDALAMTGLLGLLGQLALWGAWLYTALVLLGLAPGRGSRRMLVGLLVGGTVLGGLGWFWRPGMTGALLALGMLAGLGMYLIAALARAAEPVEIDPLALAMLGAGTAMVAEGAFGIRTVVTETVIWILAGLLLARALGERKPAAVASTTARARTRRKDAAEAGAEGGGSALVLDRRGAGLGIVLGLAASGVLYSLWLFSVPRLRDTSAILVLLLIGVAAVAALAAADARRGVFGTTVVALAVPALYSVLRAIVLAVSPEAGALYAATVLWMLVLVLLAGWLLAPAAEIGAPPAAGPQVIGYLLPAIGAVAAIVVLAINPVRGDIAYQRAVLNWAQASTQGDSAAYERAVAEFDVAIAMQPRDDGYYLRWAEFHTEQAQLIPDVTQALGVYERAQDLLQEAEALNPENAYHTFNRGHLQLLVAERLAATGAGDPSGLASQAEITLAAAFVTLNFEPQVANELALARLLQGKSNEAIQLLEFSRDLLDGENAQTWQLLARAYEMAGRTAESEAAVVRATELGGGDQDPGSLLQRADLARQQGDMDTAISFYEQAVSNLGQNVDWKVLYNLGLLYLDNNQSDKAVEVLGGALSRATDQESADQIQSAMMSLLSDGASPPPGFPGAPGGAPQVP